MMASGKTREARAEARLGDTCKFWCARRVQLKRKDRSFMPPPAIPPPLGPTTQETAAPDDGTLERQDRALGSSVPALGRRGICLKPHARDMPSLDTPPIHSPSLSLACSPAARRNTPSSMARLL